MNERIFIHRGANLANLPLLLILPRMRQLERYGVDMIVEGEEKGRKDKSLYDPNNKGRSEQLNSFASDNEPVYAGEHTGVAVRFRDPELGFGDSGILRDQ